MRHSWTRLILPALLIAGLVVYCRGSRPLPPTSGVPSPPRPSSSARLALPLLEGLTEGDAIGEWKVTRVYVEAAPNGAPQIAIDFGRSGSFVSVYVARKEAVANAPITTGRYAISHGHLRPEGEPIPPGTDQRLGEEIAARVRRTENTAPTPTGL